MKWRNKGSSLLLAMALVAPAATQATPFQNGTFDTDFTGWEGELDDFFSPQTVDPDTAPYFNIVSGQAQVSLDDTWFSNTLYQDFTLGALSPGDTLNLSFQVHWSPTDSTQDLFSATLEDIAGTDVFDLLDGVATSDLLNGVAITRDITPFAQTWGGQEVELAFNITDVDFDTGDTLRLDDIQFQLTPASVPEPPIALLLLTGMWGLWRNRHHSRRGRRA